VHGAVLIFWTLFALFVGFVALWALFPDLGVVLKLDEASQEGTRDVWAAGIFFSLALLLALGTWVVFWTREILGLLFLLNFAAYVRCVRRCA